MRIIAVPLFLLGYYIACVSCDEYNKDYSSRMNDLVASATGDASDEYVDKRAERYSFGLGKRAYTYTTGGPGVKRLPVYNFGLGKRARPYSFGLGKRHMDDNDYTDNQESPSIFDLMVLPVDSKYDVQEKRGLRPYSFGLGKRYSYDEKVQRRSANQKYPSYNFGLGKR